MRPEPKPQNVVCTACGLGWAQHGENPTLETCVRLLVAELAKRPATRGPLFPHLPNTIGGSGGIQPYQAPYTQPNTGAPTPRPAQVWC